MPRATIWITEENYPLWQDIENKSGWINTMLQLADAEIIEIEEKKHGTSRISGTSTTAEQSETA